MNVLCTILIALFSMNLLSPMDAAGAEPPITPRATVTSPTNDNEYVVGSGDHIKVWALGLEDLYEKPVVVNPDGSIALPLVGRVAVAGMTVQAISDVIAGRLKSELKDPEITVTIVEYKSHPVSVLGAVNAPGVHYLQGRKTLSEVLAMAGGLRSDAGYTVKITRAIATAGRLSLPSAKDDETGRFSIGEVQLKDFLDAQTPGQNIVVRADDMITVPRAQLVYVLGEVSKAGGFVLNERAEMSSVQALSLAGGMTITAAPKNARVLRNEAGSGNRKEIPINIAKVLSGQAPDMPLRADDILFVPDSKTKRLTAKMLETSLNLITGVIIWR
jgi:polysaccharide biosynthesis/export protein